MIKVVFFGTEGESALVLGKLIAGGFDIAAVVTKPDSARGRGRKIDAPAVKKLAEQHGIKVLQSEKLVPEVIASVAKQFSQNNLYRHGNKSPRDDLVGVLVSYGKIIPQSVIDIFPHGIINIHPSLLPKYRGPSPIETAIANGDAETGVSLMALSAQMDAGPVYVQEKVTIDDANKPTLYKKLFTVGSKLLLDNIDSIVNGGLKPTAQDDTQATYTQLLTKADGDLDPATMTAGECERKVRAYLGFPRTRITFHGQEIIVTQAKALEGFAGDDWPDVVKCANNTFLQIIEIISPNSGKQMKTADYLRGLRL
jgi:methionyl-tRNA formyltransferase